MSRRLVINYGGRLHTVPVNSFQLMLKALGACRIWVGGCSLAWVWEHCTNTNYMDWLLGRLFEYEIVDARLDYLFDYGIYRPSADDYRRGFTVREVCEAAQRKYRELTKQGAIRKALATAVPPNMDLAVRSGTYLGGTLQLGMGSPDFRFSND
jgi:hypothetical protein